MRQSGQSDPGFDRDLARRELADRLLQSRAGLAGGVRPLARSREAAEGGCGVLGVAANVPVAGRHLVAASIQMHNRGNGKGGGIAAAGLDASQMRVSGEVLRTHYLIQIAYLDPGARTEVERACISGRFDIAETYAVETRDRSHVSCEVEPPQVVRYFCRVKPEALARFAEENGLRHLPGRRVEDEYVYQNSFRLNQRYYSSLGQKRAFVLCHGRDLLVFKIVGYAEEALAHYCLEDLRAQVWISHQRYPTKGRIWHPGGAHPFVGVNEALVHNGDFANYHRVTEYLRQRNIVPLFLTDTEVSVLLFDLWDRIYGYPLEVLLEALAPTTERDFDMLPPDKQKLYRAIQQTHLQGSPDGPWFFIICRSNPDAGVWQLLGITDTSMLRPQVFALYESGDGEKSVRVGLVASERQAINACLRSLADEDARFERLADKYWVARGGSHTDGGAFVFTVSRGAEGLDLSVRDKFSREVVVERQTRPRPGIGANPEQALRESLMDCSSKAEGGGAQRWFGEARDLLGAADIEEIERWVAWSVGLGSDEKERFGFILDALTLARDRRYDPGSKKRSALLARIDAGLCALLRGAPAIAAGAGGAYCRIDARTESDLRAPSGEETALVLDASGFPAEGESSAARVITRSHALGWKRIISFDWRGGRFAGCGLGPDTEAVRLDVFGDSGDYLGSGLDGAEIVVHGDAQDQVGQILKRGRLVIHGDVGQTLLYGAKGGDVFVLGSAAGRPLINAVGRPRVVINGTCLDYLAESFMAGDPLAGGGFAIVNGITFDAGGSMLELPTPYSGGNLFSLASGGAIYLRDPQHKVDDDQLNGGRFAPLSTADWDLIEPYLRENESLFGVRVADLLTVDGKALPPERVYRRVEVRSLEVLQ